jgi:DNA-binding transcriptional LysR family regulator
VELDTTHLRSFLAIVRYGGFHRAAEALHLTQPAISRHIRRLEAQLGQPLFARRGRGVQLTAFGERAVTELGAVVAAHDNALLRLERDGDGGGPFVLGSMENLFDPLLPEVISAVRDQLGDRPLQLRIDRSRDLYARYQAGELDAAIMFDMFEVRDHPDAVDLGPLTLWWWTSAEHRLPEPLPDPFPLVAYDAPCSLRDLALGQLASLGMRVEVVAEAPHLSGVQAAARNGLGAALLGAGGDGLRRVTSGPLAAPLQSRLWLLSDPAYRPLAAPIRAVLRAAAPALRPVAAAA